MRPAGEASPGAATNEGADLAPPSGRRGAKDRDGSNEIRAALISAVATIAAAVIAGAVAVTTGNLHVTFDGDSSNNDELRATATSLQEQVDALSQQNDDLQRQLAAETADDDDGESAGPTSTTSVPTEPEIRRATGETPYPLEYGREFDLDSEPTDGDWGLLSGGADVSLQIGSIERELSTSGTSARMAIVDSPPSYDICASEEGLLYKGSLDTEEVVSGRMLCYQSSEGRWAYIRIANLDDEARVATFEIIVWKLPTDP